MSDLFGPTWGSVYTIPPGANFLNELAEQLATQFDLKSRPDALADALIYVPNRRSERALAFALHKAGGRSASLLPDIRALGDLETEDPPPSAEAALAELPPVMQAGERIGSLTRLVMAYFKANGTDMPAASCLSAARELARLLDRAALSGDVDWNALKSMEMTAQLAGHWKQSLDFLAIITDQWPAQLEDAARMDPYARRYAAAEAMAAEWQARPPKTPIIIAGSTGATPASRLLMKSALTLEQGLVVLPGLDRDLTPQALNEISETPSHPQFALARTLSELSLTPQQVQPWPLRSHAPAQEARRRLIHEALAPAPNTADWTERLSSIAQDGDVATFVHQALEGLTHIEAEDDAEEALLAALMLRETLEHEDQTAALVTPDAGLARQVSGMLKRWDVDLAPSAGLPLPQTQAGSLALLVADWLLDPSHPIALMAVLNHPSCRFEQSATAGLDRFFLRGPRLWDSWPGLMAHVDQVGAAGPSKYRPFSAKDLENTERLLGDVLDVLGQIERPHENVILGQAWFQTIAEVATEIATAPHPWCGEDGAALSTLMRHLTDLAGPLGDQPPQVWNEILQAEAVTVSVASGASHPRLAIWGPLEARLQTADRIILAGLNEGIWPAQPAADAFLPRAFRHKIGLTDPDERIGLSAHDFAQLAAAPNVTILSSQRREDKPAVASRWLWRLQTLTRGALGQSAKDALTPTREAHPAQWLKALKEAPALPSNFTSEPRPKPPLSARPNRLSVTRVEQLVRDPYAIYCEYILGLQPLDALNLPPDTRVRGIAIHKALELFEHEPAQQTQEGLLSLLEAELRNGGEAEADILALRERRRDVCGEYLEWRARQQPLIVGRPHTEMKGEIQVKIGSERFTLFGTADRIENRVDNALAILDFKSGKPPSEKQVRAGLSPQMPLQGLIAREGGYADLGHQSVEALTYVRFGTSFEVQEIGAARSRLDAKPIDEIIADTEAGLLNLLTMFADPDHPYLSAPRPERVVYESAYTRLARRDEWTGLASFD